MKKLDMKSWNRKEHFDYYHTLSDPRYSLTFEVDVTDVYSFAKEKSLSFYYCMVFLVTKAMNSIENFRYIIKGDEVYILDELAASYTDLRKDSDAFFITSMYAGDSIYEFCRAALERKQNQNSFYSFNVSPLEMVHISSVPWVFMTGLVREKNENGKISSNDTAPHVVWGKYKDIGGRKILNMNVEVNHQTVDGLHIGRFYETFMKMAGELKNEG